MSVTLRKRSNGDGSTSLILDIYQNGKRSYEFLKELKLYKPANPIDRQANKDKLDQARRIAIKMAQELTATDYFMVTDTGKKTIVTEWMQKYVDSYKKKDKRNMQGVLNRFDSFLKEDKELLNLTFGKLTETIIIDFQDYLRHHSTGEGASSYFSRFKKMVKQAYRQNLLIRNPAAEVRTVAGSAKKKDTLTLKEIQTLANTETESKEVKRAFLFSCLTGLRWVEVKSLKWADVNISNKYCDVFQGKGEKYKRVSLNETALSLIGKTGKPAGSVFSLPTANGANKSLKAWVTRAGIQKKITWHNARHSFGTNLIYSGADLSTARDLLGHSTFKHTQRYVTAANELKERATDKLNIDL